MLRAISEIAVASSVWSVLGMSRPTASARARWRAVTTSASDSIAIRSAASGAKEPLLEKREPLLEVQGGLHVLEAHAELDHRERDLRLDADDHGLGAAQPGHHRDPPQRARDERVHDVRGGAVTNDPARAWRGAWGIPVAGKLKTAVSGKGGLIRGDKNGPCLRIG